MSTMNRMTDGGRDREVVLPAMTVRFGRFRALYALAEVHRVMGAPVAVLVARAQRRYTPWFVVSSLVWGALALWAIVLPLLATDALSEHHIVMGFIVIAVNVPRWVAVAWTQVECAIAGHSLAISRDSAVTVTRHDVMRYPLALAVAFCARAIPAALVVWWCVDFLFQATSAAHRESLEFSGWGIMVYAALFGMLAFIAMSAMFVLSLVEAPVLRAVTVLVSRQQVGAIVDHTSVARARSRRESVGEMIEFSMPVIAARFSLFGHAKKHPLVMCAMADLHHHKSPTTPPQKPSQNQ